MLKNNVSKLLYSSLEKKDESLDRHESGCGRYVHNLGFSQLGDKSDSSKHDSLKLSMNLRNSKVLSPSSCPVSEQHSVEECNDNHVAHGTNLKRIDPTLPKCMKNIN